MSFEKSQGRSGPMSFPVGQSENVALQDQPDFSVAQSEVAELVFDSAKHPAAAGLRASPAQARQLLYRLGTVCVDVCMQPELGSQEIVLLGQLLDSQQPGRGMGDIPVSLLCEDRPISQNKTNAVGEFYFGFRALHGAQLVFGMTDHRKLIVPVPDMDA